MKVPTADYSPIERANQSKYNALKASYAAKDAANWKIRNEHAEKGFGLQQKSLDLNAYSTTVSAVALGLRTAVSVGEGLYNLKKQHDQEEAQYWLDTQGAEGFAAAQERDTTAPGQVDAEVNQWHDEEGNPLTGDDRFLNGAGKGPEAEQPPSAVDQWQEEAFRQIDGQKWTKDTKEWAKRQVGRQVSGLAVEKIQQRITEYETQGQRLYQANLQNDFDRDAAAFARTLDISFTTAKEEDGREGLSFSGYINGGIDGIRGMIESAEPSRANQRTTAFAGQGMTAEQASAYAEPFLAQNRQAYQDTLYRNVLNTALDRDGLGAAMGMTDTLLPDRYSDEEKEEIRKGLRSRWDKSLSDMKASGESDFENLAKGGKLDGAAITSYNDSLDSDGSIAAGLISAKKHAFDTRVGQWLEEEIIPAELAKVSAPDASGNITEKCLDMAERISDGGDLAGWFTGNSLLRDATVTQLREMASKAAETYGKDMRSEVQAALEACRVNWVNGKVSTDDLIYTLTAAVQASIDGGYGDLSFTRYVRDTLEDVYKTSEVSAQKNFDTYIRPLMEGLIGVSDKDDLSGLSAERRDTVTGAYMSAGKMVLDFCRADTGGFTAEDYKALAERVTATFGGKYVDAITGTVNNMRQAGGNMRDLSGRIEIDTGMLNEFGYVSYDGLIGPADVKDKFREDANRVIAEIMNSGGEVNPLIAGSLTEHKYELTGGIDGYIQIEDTDGKGERIGVLLDDRRPGLTWLYDPAKPEEMPAPRYPEAETRGKRLDGAALWRKRGLAGSDAGDTDTDAAGPSPGLETEQAYARREAVQAAVRDADKGLGSFDAKGLAKKTSPDDWPWIERALREAGKGDKRIGSIREALEKQWGKE